ncbi:MAG: hypothetical protein QXG39_03345 [Candidatus Aenigmatarchaeota archaeon]
MVLENLFKKKKEKTFVIKVENIPPELCKTFLKGEVDQDGTCLLRIRTHEDKPISELRSFEYIPSFIERRKPEKKREIIEE